MLGAGVVACEAAQWLGGLGAREAGLAVETVEFDLAAFAGAKRHRDGYRGRAKLVVDTTSNTVAGATFARPEVGELLHAATVAVVGGVSLDVL